MNPLVILPTYNEIENLGRIVPEVLSAIKSHILVIDDNSPDGTGGLAERLGRELDSVHVLHRPRKLGLGSAYLLGFRWALEREFDVVVQMDSDFSHSPGDLGRLVAGLEGADLILGSRYVPGGSIENWPKHRLWVSAFGNFYARRILGLSIRDLTGGFKAFKRRVLESLGLEKIISEGYAFQIETTFRALEKGFQVREIPIVFRDRTRGRSKISRRVVWEAMGVAWKLRFGVGRTGVSARSSGL